MSDSLSKGRDIEADARRTWFRETVLPHEADLRDYVRRIGCGQVDVEALVQAVLVRLISNQSWRKLVQPAAVMRATARNLVADAMKGERVVSLKLVGDLQAAASREPSGLEKGAAGRDELRRLARIVAKLPAQQRRVFLLRTVDGLGVGLIAQRLGLPVQAVEAHLVRSLRTCSERLARDLDPHAHDGTGSEPTAGGHQGRGRPLGRAPR